MQKRAARGFGEEELRAAAERAGLAGAAVNAAKLAKAAGVSRPAAWAWLAGNRVSPETDRRCRAALGLEGAA